MKLSISNLSWGNKPIIEFAESLEDVGIDGVEIAPSLIWPEPEKVHLNDVKKVKEQLLESGLKVSGIQSLLYGHPEFQLFQPEMWRSMKMHLEKMFELSSTLDSKVAVFGSPKNRIKGNLNSNNANEIASEFLASLVPSLENNDVVLTLEPNAREYGADYLISYEDVCSLSQIIGSNRIAPQIDTGCLWMNGEQPKLALMRQMPHHIHLSTPNLGEVPGESNFKEFLDLAKELNYSKWITIETLSTHQLNPSVAAKWLRTAVGRKP